jgi:hypothetical protein
LRDGEVAHPVFTVQLTAPEEPASTNRSPCRTRSLWFWRFSAHVRPVLRETGIR